MDAATTPPVTRHEPPVTRHRPRAGTDDPPGRLYLWLCPILLIGAYLRWHRLGAQSLWLDEAYSWGLAHLTWSGIWGAMLSVSDTSPLYYVLLRIAAPLFGFSEFGLRALSAFAGWLALAVAYRAGRALLGRPIGSIAAGLLAVSPFAVWFSQDARPYGFFLLWSAFALWGFWRAVRGRGWGMFVASSALLYLTHYAAALLVYAQLGFLLGELRRRPLLLRRWVLAQVLAALPVGGWVALFLARRQPVTANTWIPPASPFAPLQTIVNFLTGDAARLNFAAAAIGLAAVTFIALGLRPFNAQKRLLAWWLFFPLLSLFALSIRLPSYVDRYFEPGILACLLLIVAGAFTLSKPAQVLALSLFAGLMIWSSARLYSDPQFAKEDWRGAGRYLAAHPTISLIRCCPTSSPIGLPDAETNLGILPYAPAGAAFAPARDEADLNRLAQAGPFRLILRSPFESNHALGESQPFDPLSEGPAFFRDWRAAHPDTPVTVRPFVGLAVVEIGEAARRGASSP